MTTNFHDWTLRLAVNEPSTETWSAEPASTSCELTDCHRIIGTEELIRFGPMAPMANSLGGSSRDFGHDQALIESRHRVVLDILLTSNSWNPMEEATFGCGLHHKSAHIGLAGLLWQGPYVRALVQDKLHLPPSPSIIFVRCWGTCHPSITCEDQVSRNHLLGVVDSAPPPAGQFGCWRWRSNGTPQSAC